MKLNITCLFIGLFILNLSAQELSTNQVKSLISSYKKDPRGPYKRIKWFCKDGTEREPRDPCPDDIGGIQHAKYKKSLEDLRKNNHLFFGEILANEDIDAFLDEANFYNRLKQYQMNRYLFSVDDGWVLRRAQYYRGAFQSEDEEAWGKDFFLKVLKNDDFINEQYYLIRQALKDIPHNGDNNLAQLMRSQSKTLSEDYSDFMDLRIKIHGQPDISDIKSVENFYSKHLSKLSLDQKNEFKKLINTMKAYFAPINFNDLRKDLNTISEKNTTPYQILESFLNSTNKDNTEELIKEIANVLYTVRHSLTENKSPKDRLKILDITNQLEQTLFIESQKWKAKTLFDISQKINFLSCAAVGTGLVEAWEYNAIEKDLLAISNKDTATINDLNSFLNKSRSLVEWSSAMPKAVYNDVISTYDEFEPLAFGFIDDKVRSSIALNLGESVADLGLIVSRESQLTNNVMSLNSQSSFRGLNPGYAKGKLVVVDGNPDAIEVNPNYIYVFERPPHDLKPVAGIMTVSEGNLVSHVQLLARNLGIPNSALSQGNLIDLKKYNGQDVFYAVSNKGTVILKEVANLSTTEEQLFLNKNTDKNIIEVPTEDIRLDVNNILSMRDVSAKDSGKLCGPKAANLGELKHMFPDQVVESLIIPFGVFKSHMNQVMLKDTNVTYWQYLLSIFNDAKDEKSNGVSESVIENNKLKKLDVLHKAIINMPLKDSFITDIKNQFQTIFKGKLGDVPVFLRSDTNMEDLKEFTGAGLNLTLFNILDKDKILEGIKRVWASPYTERSFKWRQKYLTNPENVYPSILIIPSVDVDYSGVMITKGINSGNNNDLTVAFSLGAGGAVDGQSAETRLITNTNDVLLAPARQLDYIRLPQTGGVKKYKTSFHSSILNKQNIYDIRKLATNIRSKLSEDEVYDVEFGFKDNKLWLFQIRPFVENKQANSSEYLNSITPKINANQKIKLTTTL